MRTPITTTEFAHDGTRTFHILDRSPRRRTSPSLDGEHFPHSGPCPRPAQVGEGAFGVEPVGDFGFEQAVLDEPAVDLVDDGDFRVGARLQDHAVGLQALVLAARQLPLHRTGLVDQHTAQTVACWSALAEAEFDQSALAREHLRGKLPAVFARHRTLDAFDDGGHGRAVVLELLCAVGDLNPGAAADVLVVGAFVRVLEATPAAHVVDENDLEIGRARLHVGDQLLECLPPVDAQSALALVGVGADDFDVAPGDVLADLVALVLRHAARRVAQRVDRLPAPVAQEPSPAGAWGGPARHDSQHDEHS